MKTSEIFSLCRAINKAVKGDSAAAARRAERNAKHDARREQLLGELEAGKYSTTNNGESIERKLNPDLTVRRIIQVIKLGADAATFMERCPGVATRFGWQGAKPQLMDIAKAAEVDTNAFAHALGLCDLEDTVVASGPGQYQAPADEAPAADQAAEPAAPAGAQAAPAAAPAAAPSAVCIANPTKAQRRAAAAAARKAAKQAA